MAKKTNGNGKRTMKSKGGMASKVIKGPYS